MGDDSSKDLDNIVYLRVDSVADSNLHIVLRAITIFMLLESVFVRSKSSAPILDSSRRGFFF